MPELTPLPAGVTGAVSDLGVVAGLKVGSICKGCRSGDLGGAAIALGAGGACGAASGPGGAAGLPREAISPIVWQRRVMGVVGVLGPGEDASLLTGDTGPGGMGLWGLKSTIDVIVINEGVI